MNPSLLKYMFVGSLLSLTATSIEARPAECNELIAYRDTKLVSDLTSNLKGYSGAVKSLELLQGLKNETQTLRKKQPTVSAALQLTLAFQTVANSIGNILQLNPSTGVAVTGAKAASGWAGKILKAAEGTSIANAITSKKLSHHLALEAIAENSSVGTALKAAYELADNLKEHKEAYKDGQEILNLLDQNAATLERQISKANDRIKSSQFQIEAANGVKNYIDGLCN